MSPAPRAPGKDWVAVERIVFREAVQLPAGRVPTEKGAPPIYASNEKIVGAYPRPAGMMAKQHYHLWVDVQVNAIVEHPDTGEREYVPWGNVASYRPKGESEHALSMATKGVQAGAAAKSAAA